MSINELVEQANRSMVLANTIAADAINRIEEEFPDIGVSNAAFVTVMGYFAGMIEGVEAEGASFTDTPLFASAKNLGRNHADFDKIYGSRLNG